MCSATGTVCVRARPRVYVYVCVCSVQDFVHEGVEFCLHPPSSSCNQVKLDYKPYTCPHPLVTELAGKCDATGAGTSAYPTN